LKYALVYCAVTFAPLALADGLRDPTRPPLAPTHLSIAHEPPPILSAVMGANGSRTAIFNGRLVRSGGSVGAYVIEAVFEDGVRYRHAGLTRELRLPHATIPFKKPSAAPARLSAGVQ
jgi:hypothetical protein